jgi:hypothetical protein
VGADIAQAGPLFGRSGPLFKRIECQPMTQRIKSREHLGEPLSAVGEDQFEDWEPAKRSSVRGIPR